MKLHNYVKTKSLLLLPILLWLAGCATNSPTSATACPQLPLPPVAQEPAPSVPYSVSVQTDLLRWETLLRDSMQIQ